MSKLNWKPKVDTDTANDIAQLKKQLADTDFYLIRRMETGQQVPGDVQAMRNKIRQKLKDNGL